MRKFGNYSIGPELDISTFFPYLGRTSRSRCVYPVIFTPEAPVRANFREGQRNHRGSRSSFGSYLSCSSSSSRSSRCRSRCPQLQRLLPERPRHEPVRPHCYCPLRIDTLHDPIRNPAVQNSRTSRRTVSLSQSGPALRSLIIMRSPLRLLEIVYIST